LSRVSFGAESNYDEMPQSVARAAAIAAVSISLAFWLSGAIVSPVRAGRVLADGYPMIPAGLASAASRSGTGAASISSAGSLNWAGYAVTASRATFTSVRATFFVPYLNCPESPGAALSSAWVALTDSAATPGRSSKAASRRATR
jgi:hypothetical protein